MARLEAAPFQNIRQPFQNLRPLRNVRQQCRELTGVQPLERPTQ
jgi:hypothetical protein